jgi:hypothetical protein
METETQNPITTSVQFTTHFYRLRDAERWYLWLRVVLCNIRMRRNTLLTNLVEKAPLRHLSWKSIMLTAIFTTACP